MGNIFLPTTGVLFGDICKKYVVNQCSGSLVAKLYLTLGDPMDCIPPGSSVHGIFKARILEWVAISYSRGAS